METPKKAKTRRFYIGIGTKICSRSVHIWPKELAPRGALLLWQIIVAPLGPITDCITNCALSLSVEIGLILPIARQLWHFFPSQGNPSWSKIHILPALSDRQWWIVHKLAHGKLCAILRNWIVAFLRIFMLVTVIDVIGYAGPSLRLVVHCVGLLIALRIVLSLSLLWDWFKINYYWLRCQLCSLSLFRDWFDPTNCLPIVTFFPIARKPLPVQNPHSACLEQLTTMNCL